MFLHQDRLWTENHICLGSVVMLTEDWEYLLTDRYLTRSQKNTHSGWRAKWFCVCFFCALENVLKSYLKSDGFFFVAIYRGIERLKPLIHNKNIISFAINLPKLVDSVPYFYLLFYSPKRQTEWRVCKFIFQKKSCLKNDP